jgi:hypothetical protein
MSVVMDDLARRNQRVLKIIVAVVAALVVSSLLVGIRW